MFNKTVAEREKINLMIGITGPSGAGKTYTALQLAYGITQDWKKIIVADTENRSALYYAGSKTGEWSHVDFPPTMRGGYCPDNWCSLIDFAEADKGCEVLILDSISHEWQGTGGILEMKTRLGDRFDSWAKVSPLHTKFMDKMRNSSLHIIATMRSKQDYVVEVNDKGKNAPRKVGMASIQREGTEYEFGIIFDLAMNHLASSSKDRTGLFEGREFFEIGAHTGKELIEWTRAGKERHGNLTVIFNAEDAEHIEALGKLLAPHNILLGSPEADGVARTMHGKAKTLRVFEEVLATVLDVHSEHPETKHS